MAQKFFGMCVSSFDLVKIVETLHGLCWNCWNSAKCGIPLESMYNVTVAYSSVQTSYAKNISVKWNFLKLLKQNPFNGVNVNICKFSSIKQSCWRKFALFKDPCVKYFEIRLCADYFTTENICDMLYM